MDDARARADDSVSARFTRVMNATTSRWGMLTDPWLVGLATAPIAVAALAAARLDADQVVRPLELAALLPLVVAFLVALGLRSARAEVVAWLAAKPFPVENMNAVLNGLGEALEVTFVGAPPPAKELNAALDLVSPECFVSDEGEGSVALRIGVVDDKRNPSASNHQRFVRVLAIVDQVLAPLCQRRPIVEVRVK